ncbi:pLS20_p028 family conjugation system transmembrane protein [Enterococcus sp. LJL98]
MNKRIKEIPFRKIAVLMILSVLLICVTQPSVIEAVSLGWFDTEQQTTFLKEHGRYLQYADGFFSVILNQVSWLIIKGAYWISSSIEGLIPESLSLFSFIESNKMTAIYQSVINGVVISLMILSLIFIGYKMITGRGVSDLKTIGMNVFMSIVLILLMPTLISSGMTFAKVIYSDSTQTASQSGSVAWSLVEDGVTDLVYINKNQAFNQLENSNLKRNLLDEAYFYQTNFSEVLTDKLIDQMKKENEEAENLRYHLTINSEGKPEAVKISDGILSMFSDSLQTGYFRYKVNFFAVITSLLSLAVAYVFSLIVIISSIIELAFKKVFGVLVFATDLESGQKSKVVLSDIMECFLTIGFQGFGLAIFSIFLSYLNSGEGITQNIIIKIFAHVCATLILIKGSQSIMRYFGVDIGLKEGYGQLASAVGIGALLFKKGMNGASKVGGREKVSDSNLENDNRKPEKNFGESLSSRAGKSLGYAKERGLSGLAMDGVSNASNSVKKPFKSLSNSMSDAKNSYSKAFDEGTSSAINKNSKKPVEKDQNNDSQNVPTRLSNSQEGSKASSIDKKVSSSGQSNEISAIRQKVQQEIEQRKLGLNQDKEGGRSLEEFIQQKKNEAKYTPEAFNREELINQRLGTNQSQSASQGPSERLMNVQERLNPSGSSLSDRSVNVREQSQNERQGSSERTVNVGEHPTTTSSQPSDRTVNVREQVQSPGQRLSERTVNVREQTNITSSQPIDRTVNVREQVQNSGRGLSECTVNVREQTTTTSSQPNDRTVNVREQVQNAGQGSSDRTVNVREQTNTTSSQPSDRTVNVREQVQSSGQGPSERTVNVREQTNTTSSQPSDRTVNVREQVQSSGQGPSERTVNIREHPTTTSSQPSDRTVNVREEVTVDKKERQPFTYEHNRLFKKPDNTNNPLFNFKK